MHVHTHKCKPTATSFSEIFRMASVSCIFYQEWATTSCFTDTITHYTHLTRVSKCNHITCHKFVNVSNKIQPIFSADVINKMSNVCLKKVELFTLVRKRLLQVHNLFNQHLSADLHKSDSSSTIILQETNINNNNNNTYSNRFTALCPGLPGWAGTRRTFTHSHLSWSSTILHQLPPSTIIHSILPVQFMCLTVFSHNISPSPILSTSWSGTSTFLHPIIVFFCNTCPYHSNLFAVVPKLCHLFLVCLSTLFYGPDALPVTQWIM